MDDATAVDVLRRIQMDYLEMPGLKLTARQGHRLWNLRLELCVQALETLVARGFLVESDNGAFLRPGVRCVDTHAG